MKYAVFDWDNTIRRGYTLFSWMDYLYDKKILNRNVRKKMRKVQESYSSGRINHDDYAEQACAVYAESMKGISQNAVNAYVEDYMRLDVNNIFPFAKGIFRTMRKHNVKSVIVSGAPNSIIEQYRDMFGLESVYAFSESYENGFCTGKVSCNYGLDKGKTIDKLCKLYGEKPFIGFGDSYSDIPIFELSKYAFCVLPDTVKESSNDKKYGSDVTYIERSMSEDRMIFLLEQLF